MNKTHATCSLRECECDSAPMYGHEHEEDE